MIKQLSLFVALLALTAAQDDEKVVCSHNSPCLGGPAITSTTVLREEDCAEACDRNLECDIFTFYYYQENPDSNNCYLYRMENCDLTYAPWVCYCNTAEPECFD